MAGKHAGSGSRLLLMIPGFGNDRHWFDGLFDAIPEGWTFVAFDLPPFYGSHWTPDTPIPSASLGDWLRAASQHFYAEEVHLLAFSLGARVALGSYLADPALVKSLILISPDGLRVHPMYAFAMYTRVGNFLFRRVLSHPSRFLRIVRILYRMKLLSGSIYHLAMAQFESEARRKRLYKTWLAWSGIRPKLEEIVAASAHHGTTWHVFWGKQDKVLSPRLGRRFCQKVPGAHLQVVDGGHFMVKNPTAAFKDIVAKLFEGDESK